MTAPFPTRKDEAYRYADFDALKQIWDALPAPERILIAAQQNVQQVWLPCADEVQVRNVEVAVESNASCTIFALNTASTYGRIALDVTLAENANFEFHAANIGGDESTLEIVTIVRHLAPAATSRQTVRSVLGGKATGSYVGKVAVSRDAQQTDSEQSVKAMLLDRGATANCKPELEIFADDVKCAHGASVGELDAAQLFYAESRGLGPAAARALLLEGFIAGLWDDVADEVQRTNITAAARDALRVIA